MAISIVVFLFTMLTSLNLNLPLVEMLLVEEELPSENSPIPSNGLAGVTPDPGHMARVALAPRNIL